jgi:D-tyrosyl-tRNA(Tyr) deacylase
MSQLALTCLYFLSAILQRVISASVTVDKQVVSSIGKGILVLAAVAPGDTEKEVDALAAKVIKMKLWDDEETGGRWKHNVQDISGDVLCGILPSTRLPLSCILG